MLLDKTITEIAVKVILTGEFHNYDSWIKNVQECALQFGFESKLLHQDKKGYSTNGYNLKNYQNESPYPVKTYLLIQDPELAKPLPYHLNQ